MNIKEMFVKERKVPKVIIEDKNLEKAMGRWLGTQVNVSKKFGEVLINVGFKASDEIVLCKYQEKTLSFTYIVNGKNPYKKNTIWLSFENADNKNPHIIVTTGSKNTKSRMVYQAERTNKNKIGNKFEIISYSSEDKRYGMLSRRYDEMNAEFFVEKDDYELHLSVKEPMYLFLKRNGDGIYRIKNEKELINYLTSLRFPVEIDSVYKKICEISLGNISLYPEISLKVTKYDMEEGLEDVTDMIEIVDGKFSSFGMTRNGKTIILDSDGNWTYEKKLSDMTAIVQYDNDDDKFSYGSVYDGGLGTEKLEEVTHSEMRDIAINDIDTTKKLVRSMLNK